MPARKGGGRALRHLVVLRVRGGCCVHLKGGTDGTLTAVFGGDFSQCRLLACTLFDLLPESGTRALNRRSVGQEARRWRWLAVAHGCKEEKGIACENIFFIFFVPFFALIVFVLLERLG